MQFEANYVFKKNLSCIFTLSKRIILQKFQHIISKKLCLFFSRNKLQIKGTLVVGSFYGRKRASWHHVLQRQMWLSNKVIRIVQKFSLKVISRQRIFVPMPNARIPTSFETTTLKESSSRRESIMIELLPKPNLWKGYWIESLNLKIYPGTFEVVLKAIQMVVRTKCQGNMGLKGMIGH